MKNNEQQSIIAIVLKSIIYMCVPILVILLLITPVPKASCPDICISSEVKMTYILIIIILALVSASSIILLIIKISRQLHRTMNIPDSEFSIEILKDEIKTATEEYNRAIYSNHLKEMSDVCKNLETHYLDKNKYSLLRTEISYIFGSIFFHISKLAIDNLSEDDYLFCALSILKYSQKEIELITRWSSSAIKSRRYHLKKKIPNELYQILFK